MVALRTFFISLLISLFFFWIQASRISYGMPTPIEVGADSTLIRQGSWQSLVHCQKNQSVFWAKLLDRLNSDSSFLYRLAWLQVAAVEPKNDFQNDLQDSFRGSFKGGWGWKWSGEIWSDELDLWKNHSSLCIAPDSSVELQNLPQEVLRALMESRLPFYIKSSEPVRSALKNYLVFLYTRESQIPSGVLPNDEAPPTWSHKEKCEWNALRLLYSESAQVSSLQTTLENCRAFGSEKDPLWVLLRLRLGDLYFKRAQSDEALSFYREAQDKSPVSLKSSGFKYRIAASALLSQSADDLAFRTAYELLSEHQEDQPKEQTELDLTYRGIIENLVCDRVYQLRPQEAIRAFSRVFQPGARVLQSLTLTHACEPQRMGSFWRELLRQSSVPRDQAKVLGRILLSSLSQGNLDHARSSVLSLAQISHRLPFISSHEFWRAISQVDRSIEMKKFQSILDLYKKKSNWQTLDDEREKSLLARKLRQGFTPNSQSSSHALSLDHGQDAAPLKLPVVYISVPHMDLNLNIRENLVQLFHQSLKSNQEGLVP